MFLLTFKKKIEPMGFAIVTKSYIDALNECYNANASQYFANVHDFCYAGATIKT